MNSQNQDSKNNGHKPSEKDDGLQTLALLQKIKDGQFEANSIEKAERKLLVRFLNAEGKSTAEIAHLLKVSDRTIERDKKALREEIAITKDPKLVEQMVGMLVYESELSIQRLRKVQRLRYRAVVTNPPQLPRISEHGFSATGKVNPQKKSLPLTCFALSVIS